MDAGRSRSLHMLVDACTSDCKPARRRRKRARVFARMHAVVHACSSMYMRARGTCVRARRCACVHEAHARVLEDVRACRAACWLARMMFWLARAPGLQAPQG